MRATNKPSAGKGRRDLLLIKVRRGQSGAGDCGVNPSLRGQGAEIDTGICHVDQAGPFAKVKYYKMGCVCCCQHRIWLVFCNLILNTEV